MASQVGEAVIKLTFDGKELTASLQKQTNAIEKSGSSSGNVWGNAWTVAAGALISQGISKISSMISSNLDNAIARVDTLNNSQKVFKAMGYSAESTSKSMDELTKYLDGLPTSMTSAIRNVQSLSASFGGIEKGTEIFKDMNNAGLAFGATSAMIDNAITQLGQLSMDGPLDAATWNSLRNSGFSPVFAAMAKEAGITVGELKEQFGAKGTKTVGDFLNELHRLGTEGGGDMESLAELAKKNTSGIGTAIENVQNRIGKAIAKVIDHIGSANIAKMINNISSSFSDMADVVIGGIDWIINNWDMVQQILIAVGAFFAGLLAMNITARIQAFFAMLAAFAATNPVVLAIGAIVTALVLIMTHLDQVKVAIKAVGDFFYTIFKGLGDVIIGFGDTITSVFQGVWDGITSLFGQLADFFGSIFTSAWEAVKAVFSTGGRIFEGIVDGIVSAFKSIVNAIIRGINGVVAIPFNAINGILQGIHDIDILGLHPFEWVGLISVPQIPYLAQGGYARGATNAVIGEAGKEVVLPLENNTDNWAGLLASELEKQFEHNDGVSGRPITVNMTNEINSEMDANDIGRKLMESIRRAA